MALQPEPRVGPADRADAGAAPAAGAAGALDDGFVAWYRQQWPRLVRILTAYCGDDQLATDVVAEAFVRAAERWERSRPRDPTAWATTVSFNLVKARGRRAAVEQRLSHLVHRPPPSYTPPTRNVDLWRAVEALPPRMRQAVVLRYVGDLTEAGVAEAMGIDPAYASALLSKARHRLAADRRTGPPPHPRGGRP